MAELAADLTSTKIVLVQVSLLSIKCLFADKLNEACFFFVMDFNRHWFEDFLCVENYWKFGKNLKTF